MTAADAIAILRLLAVKGVGPASGGRLLESLCRVGVPPAEIFEHPGAERVLRQHLKPEQLQAALSPNARIEEQVEKCVALDVQFVSLLDRDYPAVLRASLKAPPPVLACRGNLSLLAGRGVGFCGSRAASEKGLATATDIADQLARANVQVVSGYAAGVDQAAHRAALEAGGATVVVLPEGILHFRLHRELVDAWDWNRVLVVSEFAPGAVWSAAHAMQRNKTILGLSDVMILIEAGETGGSMAAGTEALAMKKPLFAPVYEGMPPAAVGNRLLLERGAQGLKKAKTTNRANLKSVLEYVQQTRSTPGAECFSFPPASTLGAAPV